MWVVGLMSGTSADGMDAALVWLEEGTWRLEAFETTPYSDALRQAILLVSNEGRVDQVCLLHALMGEVSAEAVISVCRKAHLPLWEVDLVGSHGQTIHHLPDPRHLGGREVRGTLQVGSPAIIVALTGITTISDFRSRDMALGGQGAPLVPLADWLLLRDPQLNRGVLNIGGIANLTLLPAGGSEDQVVAFDTGPGNMIIDALMEMATDGQQRMDRDGAWAAGGRVHEGLLHECLSHPYFAAPPPKSTGREEFGLGFARNLWARGEARGLNPQDLVATATTFTVQSICQAITGLGINLDQLIVGGGGRYNPTMMTGLQKELPGVQVMGHEPLGISSESKEAVAFALLAYETWNGRPGNVLGATGARERAVLGSITPGRNWPPPRDK